jgi:DNA modification methylase
VGDTVPSVVLDPFVGAGTTMLVAARHGRSGMGIELKPEYCVMAKNRIEKDVPLFNAVELQSIAVDRNKDGQ